MMPRSRFLIRIQASALSQWGFSHIFGDFCVRDIGKCSPCGLPYNYMLFEKKPDHGCAWRIKGNWVGIPGKAVTVCGAVPRVRLLAHGLLVSRVFWEPLDSGEQEMTLYLVPCVPPAVWAHCCVPSGASAPSRLVSLYMIGLDSMSRRFLSRKRGKGCSITSELLRGNSSWCSWRLSSPARAPE